MFRCVQLILGRFQLVLNFFEFFSAKDREVGVHFMIVGFLNLLRPLLEILYQLSSGILFF